MLSPLFSRPPPFPPLYLPHTFLPRLLHLLCLKPVRLVFPPPFPATPCSEPLLFEVQMLRVAGKK